MTVLTILSPEAIKLFDEPPKFTAADRKAYFSLPKWAEEIIGTLQSIPGLIEGAKKGLRREGCWIQLGT